MVTTRDDGRGERGSNLPATIVASVLTLAAFGVRAHGGPPNEYDLEIEAQPLARALQEFATQSGIQIVFFSQLAKGRAAPALSGRFTADAALNELLRGSELTFHALNAETIEIRPLTTTQLLRTARDDNPSLLWTSAAKPIPGRTRVAQADTTLGKSGEEPVVQEVVVTGSRIARRDYASNSPITTLGGEAFETQSAGTPEALLNTLPQIAPDIGASSTDQRRAGAANINLRGLGPRRNLVLINGRRMVGSDSSGVVDVNTIPTALIDRVEVITGGASAVYGADAVAGVVNFILKDEVIGPHLDVQYGLAAEGDAEEVNLSATFGSDFADDRGRAVLSYNYYDRGEIMMADRAFSRPSEYPTGTTWGAYIPVGNLPSQDAVNALFGSYGLAPGSALASDQFGFNDDRSLFSMSIAATAPPVANFRGSLDDPDIATHFYPGRFAYQYSPDTSLVSPLTRHSVFGSASFEVTDEVTAYGQVLYTEYEARVSQGLSVGASPTFGSAFDVPVTNPFIPADLATLLASRANPSRPFRLQTRIEALGPRLESYDNEVYQTLAGLKGRLPNDWRWDVYAARGEAKSPTLREHGGSYARIQSLLNAPDGGASICAGGLNLFGRQPVSTECAEYIDVPSLATMSLRSDIAEASISGETLQLPAGPIGFAVGAQYRAEDFDFNPDFGVRTGDLGGFATAQPVSGSFSNTDLYSEVRVPIVGGLPFAKLIALAGGYRYSEHSVVGSFSSYKLEGEWEVVDAFRLRASYQRAVRAPNIGELFAPVGNANIPIVDPCNVNSFQRTGPNAAAARELCLAQGVPASIIDAYTQPTASIIVVTGGNRNLEEEKADTYTVGAVISSPFETGAFSHMTLSLDYYTIELTEAIASLQAASFVPRCFNSQGDNPTFSNDNAFCQLFSRQFTGAIENAIQTSINVAALNLSGIDAQFAWRPPLPDGWGQLSFDVALSWMAQFERQDSPADRAHDYAGTIGQYMGDTLPDWKGVFGVTYAYDRLSIGTRMRYIDAMGNRVNVTTPGAGTNVPSTFYVDVTGTYEISPKITLRAGMLNALDQQPRLYTPQQQSRTDPSTYDVVGRRFFVGAEMSF